MIGLGMQEILLLAILLAIPVGVLAVVFVVMMLARKRRGQTDVDERVERDDIDDQE